MNISCLRIFVSETASISKVIFNFWENNNVRMFKFLSRPFLVPFKSANDSTDTTKCGNWHDLSHGTRPLSWNTRSLYRT
jgi:hypothetical protein